MTTTPPLPLLLLLLLLFIIQNITTSASASAINPFMNCLSSKIPSSQLSSAVFLPSRASSYATLLNSHVQNLRFRLKSTPRPDLIVMPATVPEIQAAVICARNCTLQMKIRSGGHDYEGISYTSDQKQFILLDMRKFSNISVDTDKETAYVQSGATLGQLYHRIAWNDTRYGFPAGVCPTVGIGGHISGGGYGNMLRMYGLSVDNVVGAEVVVADGSFLNRSAMGDDLYWALLGGGGASFCVVVSYTLRIVPVPPTVTVFRVSRTLEEDATHVVYRWQHVAPTIDNKLFMRLLLQPVTINKMRTIRATVMALYLGDADSLMEEVTDKFPELGLQKSNCTEMSWIESVAYWATNNITASVESLLDTGGGEVNFLKRKSDYVERPIGEEDLEKLWKKMMELGKVGLVMNPYGGRMNEIEPEETPFPHRFGNLYKMQYSVNWEGEEGEMDIPMYLQQARELYNFTEPWVSRDPRRAYLNYRDLDIGVAGDGGGGGGGGSYDAEAVYGRKQFAGNFDRLVRVKTTVDPHNFFSHEQSIPTAATHVFGS